MQMCTNPLTFLFPGHQTAVEGRPDGGSPGHGQDDAGEGSGHGVRHHLLQRILVHTHLQVPRGVRETSQIVIRNGKRHILYFNKD